MTIDGCMPFVGKQVEIFYDASEGVEASAGGILDTIHGTTDDEAELVLDWGWTIKASDAKRIITRTSFRA